MRNLSAMEPADRLTVADGWDGAFTSSLGGTTAGSGLMHVPYGFPRVHGKFTDCTASAVGSVPLQLHEARGPKTRPLHPDGTAPARAAYSRVLLETSVFTATRLVSGLQESV